MNSISHRGLERVMWEKVTHLLTSLWGLGMLKKGCQKHLQAALKGGSFLPDNCRDQFHGLERPLVGPWLGHPQNGATINYQAALEN